MNKQQIAQHLENMADLLEINGENPFKVRAYHNAARSLEGLAGNLEDLIAKNQLIEVKGIGKNIAAHINDLLHHGTFDEYTKLQKSIPQSVIEMLAIPGLGAKKVRLLWKSLGVTSIDELEKACLLHRVATLEGFGEKSQEKILKGIEHLRKYEGRHLLPMALHVAEKLIAEVRNIPHVRRAEIAGSLRRHVETVKDIDLVVSTSSPTKVADAITALHGVMQITNKGETKVSVLLQEGINADARLVTDKEFPFALYHFTGSKAHNVAMRSRAKEMGMKLNEYGLFKGERETLVPCEDEADIFKAFGLSFIPPELREDMGEIEAAEKKKLPTLLEDSDLKGCLHVHTTYSDGRATLEEMALAAKAEGFSYLGISDHSQSAGYAGGMDIADVKRQLRDIENVNNKLKGIRLLKGIEVDILADGSLDYPDDILRSFEFVIASVHSHFGMSEEEMTKRVCKALAHPLVDVLAHPTGRLLLSREPYRVDMSAVISCAAEHGKAIELNCNPKRFDIDWRFGPLMKEKGVKTILSPDAHAPEQIAYIHGGVGMARKAWFEKKDVLNCLSATQFLKHLNRKN